jgi:uncharacterized protein (DUF3820 family)
MSKLTDESLMPFGKYKGDKMTNVPASYLIWLYDNGKCSSDVSEYIKENLDVLNEEIKRQQSK